MTGFRLLLFKQFYFRADSFCVLSSDFKNTLESWGYSGPIYLETTVVDESLTAGASPRRRVPDEPFNILFLARIARAKGVFETVEAVSSLRRRGVDARLLIAGTGPDLDALRAEAARLLPEAHECWGYVLGVDKVELFQRAHAYVLPSDTEGMPTSVLEAMAFGLPVVTRAVGGLADFFVDGTMGFLAQERDAEEVASLLWRLAEDEPLRYAIGLHNAEYARQRFMASSVVARMEEIYRIVAGKSDTKAGDYTPLRYTPETQ